MLLNILNNEVIVGALIGSISSTIFGIVTERYKFNKQKNGALMLIKSELYENINSLNLFKEKNLKEEILIIDESTNNIEITNFYNKMINFPNLNNENWIKLISFIPNIFKPEDIEKINLFYRKCRELSENAKFLFEKSKPKSVTFGDYEIPVNHNLEIINSHRNIFRNEVEEIILMGENIKEIFD